MYSDEFGSMNCNDYEYKGIAVMIEFDGSILVMDINLNQFKHK